MKCRRLVDDTSTILAIDAFETPFSNSSRISPSLPSSFDRPSEPFLRPSNRDAVDQAVDMFDKFLTRTHTRAEHELNDQMLSWGGKTIRADFRPNEPGRDPRTRSAIDPPHISRSPARLRSAIAPGALNRVVAAPRRDAGDSTGASVGPMI
jgi:hypothetical protein